MVSACRLPLVRGRPGAPAQTLAEAVKFMGIMLAGIDEHAVQALAGRKPQEKASLAETE
jgi:hypothetical protein